MSDVYEVGGVVVDAETGAIIESDGDPIERIIAAGLEAKQQIDTWERYQRAMKAAAASMLTDDRPKVQTVAGVAKRVTQTRKRATPERLADLASELELTTAQVTAVYECARELDTRALERLADEGLLPGDVVDALITVTSVSYVQFDAIRKMAPQPAGREAVE